MVGDFEQGSHFTVAGGKVQGRPSWAVQVYVGSELETRTWQWELGVFQRLNAPDMGQKFKDRVLAPRKKASGSKEHSS